MASIQSNKGKAGKKTYYVVICHRGGHKWVKAGTLRDTKILKRESESLENSKRMEKLGLVGRHKRVDSFFQEYADHVRLRTAPSTVKRYLSVVNTFITFLRMFHPNIRFLAQITPEVIESYQMQRLESVELKAAADGDKPGVHTNKRLPLPQTVNNEVIMLGSAFIWAHKRDLIPSVPTRKVKKLRAQPTRQPRLLTPNECRLFLKTAQEMAKANKWMKVFVKAFQFLLNTGLRSGELCNLTWDDVDLNTGLIQIRPKEGWTPKSYSRQFFLNQICIDLLRSLDGSEGYIFKDSSDHQLDNDGLRKALIKVAHAAGLKDLTRVHDLRHTFNSLMQMNGVDAGTMTRILGHKDLETTMIYAHLAPDHLAEAVNRLTF